ncbi:neurogenic locus notch homolog protein 1-like [Plakobranchus ocellatus]|uniref:Delta-like protein n=1 Tax=Plakobranchus ocellatus TaxID=259542 RepID=A0AAV4AHV5_9GAST|nr:neurogenic locus notch homolog protein 1-like [Plakobranchus ocellatus]
MVNDQLVHVLEFRNLLSKVQCGFRKDHSTLDTLVRLETFLKKAFARKMHVPAFFFYLEKARDTPWRYGNLKDLFYLGFRDRKTLKGINFISRRVPYGLGADRATLLKLYRIQSGSSWTTAELYNYGSAKTRVLRALDPIHHQGLRFALGAFRTSPIESLYAEAGEPSLEHRRIKLAFNYELKLKSLPRNACHDIVFEAPLSDFSADSKSEPDFIANTYGSKLEEKVAAAAYFSEHPDRSKATRLRDGASVFSAELEGIALARIRGNENVDKLAKAALNRATCSGKFIYWSDLKPKVNAYIHTVWQENWDMRGQQAPRSTPQLGRRPQHKSLTLQLIVYCDQDYYGSDCGKFCSPGPDDHYSCSASGDFQCDAGYSGNKCEISTDVCDSKPCLNGGTCENVMGDFVCRCPDSFTGRLCEEEINECARSPCQNGGICIDGIGTFTCNCPPDFQGSLCESEIDECAGLPCQNGGTCIDGIGTFSCDCPLGFQGSICEEEIDDCAGSPCQNGGTCIDGIGTFSCECPQDFQGSLCEENIDECAGSPCQNGGTCIDGIGTFSCECPQGFQGSLCEENIDECAGSPCQNGGVCIDGIGTFKCDCARGFQGSLCEENIDECAGSPCQNGGVCIDGIGTFSCECPQGFQGSLCEENIDECAGSPCENGGTCVDGIGTFSCECPQGNRAFGPPPGRSDSSILKFSAKRSQDDMIQNKTR